MISHTCRSLIAVVLAATGASALDTVTVTTLSPTAYEQGLIAGSFLFTRDGSSGALTVSYGIAGSAVNGTDYAILPGAPAVGTVTFPAGSKTVVLPIVPVQDILVEGAETITLQLVTSAVPYTVGGLSSATVTIGDNDIEARMTGPDPVAEEVTQVAGYVPWELLQRATLHLSLSQPVPGTGFRNLPRTIPVQIAGTAKLGTNYKPLVEETDPTDYVMVFKPSNGTTLTTPVAVGATSLTIANGTNLAGYLSPNRLTSFVGTATIPDYVALTNVRDFYEVTNFSGTTTGAVTLGAGLQQAAGAGTLTHRMTYAVSNTPYTGAARGDTSINLLGVTAAAKGTIVQFEGAQGMGHQAFYLLTEVDALTKLCTISPALQENVPAGSDVYDGSGVAVFTLIAGSNALTGVTPAGSETIEYDNATGSFVPGDYIAIDGVQEIYKISAVGPTILTLSSGVHSSFGTETKIFNLGHEVAESRFYLIDNSGSVSDLDFYIFPTDDRRIEGRETVTVSLIAQPDYQSVTPTVATAIISDDDVQADIAFTSNAGEPATAGTMTVTLTSPLPQAISVPYQVVDFSGGTGIAQMGPSSGADYTLTGADPLTGIGAVVIPAGQTSAVLTFSPINDAVIEAGGETVTVNLLQGPDYWLVNSGTSGSNPSATINIADKIGTVSVTLLAGTTGREGVGANLRNPTLRFSVAAPLALVEGLGVSYSVTGTASPDADYTALSGNAIIPAGLTFVDVIVTTLDDQIVDPAESISVILSSGPGYDVSATDSSASVTIEDDEPTISITAGTSPSEAGPTVGSFTVSYPGVPVGAALNRPITVSYTVKSTSTATPGADYSALSGTVVIPASNLSTTIDLTPVDDILIDAGETVAVDLAASSAPASYSVNNTLKSAQLIITDNDVAPPTLTIAVTTDAQEPATNGLFTITASSVITGTPMVVTYSVSGTATPGTDYTALSGTVSILVGATTATIPVVIANDALGDAGETIIVTLGASGPVATMTVVDDESSVISFAVATATVVEGATSTITLTRSGSTSGAISAVVSNVAGTATAGVDYTAVSSTVSWAASESGNKTISLVTTADVTVDPGETITLALGSMIGASSGSPASMEITLQDAAAPADADKKEDSGGGGCGGGVGVAFLLGFLCLMWRRLRD